MSRVTLFKSMDDYDRCEKIHGIFRDRKHALKMLRYLYEREERYRKVEWNTEHHTYSYPRWENCKIKNEFSTQHCRYYLETYVVKGDF